MSGDALVSGIFIKNIIAESAADKCGLLRVGDRILGKIDFLMFMKWSIRLFFIPHAADLRLPIQNIKNVAISAVDGVDIRHSSHELAVKTIKNAADRMTLCVQSLNTGVSNLMLFWVVHKSIFNFIRMLSKIQ